MERRSVQHAARIDEDLADEVSSLVYGAPPWILEKLGSVGAVARRLSA